MRPDVPPGEKTIFGGMIEWMIDNKVTPNLLMVCLIAGGLFSIRHITQEVFPDFELDRVDVSVSYPGSSPEEIEQGLLLAIEAAVRDVDGVKEMTSTASEGGGSVSLELETGADGDQVRQDVQQAVDRIRTFPEDAEEPNITLAQRRREVIDLVIYGEAAETTLVSIGRQVRDRMLADPRITQAELEGVRRPEVHIEFPRETLRAHNLTINEVAQRVRQSSAELPGGQIEPEGGDIQLRVSDRRLWAEEFARIPILTTETGAVVTLGDLAVVTEGFEDVDRIATYNGMPSVGLEVYRVGDQTPIGVAGAVREIMNDMTAELPDGIFWEVRSDRSQMYEQRRNLLVKNLLLGLILVLILLGLFLEPTVAFWVTMGIPISFLGGLIFLPWFDISINMVSMFAFLVALGIVVDDAIVSGENIYAYRAKGLSYRDAAVQGAADVATPITFSILTNMLAFLPLMFVPGIAGKFWRVIPIVVITVFALSWIESIFILPEHLSHGKPEDPRERGPLRRFQFVFNRGIRWFGDEVYGRVLRFLLQWRLPTIALGVATLIAVLGYFQSGKIAQIFFPRTESDEAQVTAVMPPGAPIEEVVRVRDQLIDGLTAVVAENGGEDLVTGYYSTINGSTIRIEAYLTPPDVRPLQTSELAMAWREAAGPVEGVERVSFIFDRGGPGSGAALTVELTHRDTRVLEDAAENLAESLRQFENTSDVNDGRSSGKRQLDIRLSEGGAALGLTSNDLARQLRSSFLGNEAIRQQRIEEEMRVRVRLAEEERVSELDFENLLVTTPNGTEVPLLEVATVEWGRSYTSIQRRDGRRTVTVTADVNPLSEVQNIQATLDESVLPQLSADFPGLSYSYQGNQSRRRDSMGSLVSGFLYALIGIFILLAIPFRSYVQPIVVMVAIPFGFVGAVLGHVIMGFDWSFMSMMGLVALAGVLVNDSLLLVDYANKRRAEDPELDSLEAAWMAGTRRFRPVILTTVTTFGGLAPMMFETSRQARFLVPMAVSMGYGILFATMVTLVIIPCLYSVVEDLRKLARWRPW